MHAAGGVLEKRSFKVKADAIVSHVELLQRRARQQGCQRLSLKEILGQIQHFESTFSLESFTKKGEIAVGIQRVGREIQMRQMRTPPHFGEAFRGRKHLRYSKAVVAQ